MLILNVCSLDPVHLTVFVDVMKLYVFGGGREGV